jgi:hypothetical protein
VQSKTTAMKKYLFFLFLFFFSIPWVFAQTTFNLRIAPDNARGGTASQIFDSIKFIPLETTKESLFGAIDQLEVTDSLFIILDRRSRSILVFTRNGKLHTRITSGGTDKFFSFFTIDRNKNQIIVINNYAKGLLVYDFEGKFLRKELCPDNLQSMYSIGRNIVLYNLARPFDSDVSTKVPFDIVYSKGYDSVYKYVNHYDSKVSDGQYNIMYSPINFSGQDGSCMFSLPFEYAVYQINDTGIINKYKFVFPLEYSLPANFSSDSSFKGKRAQYVYTDHDNYKKISTITSVYRIGDYLIFSAQSGQMTMTSDWNYLYNLKNGDVFSFSKVTGDSTSFYIPIMSNMFETANGVYKGKIYSSSPAFTLFSIKDNIKKQVSYPEALLKFFSTGSAKDNPVIIESNLKPNL